MNPTPSDAPFPGPRTDWRARFGKAERKMLRELSGKAWDCELGTHLAGVAEKVDQWRASRIDSFELSDAVHKFHDGASRETWSVYNALTPDVLVARALAFGFLDEADVPETIRAALSGRIEFMRRSEG